MAVRLSFDVVYIWSVPAPDPLAPLCKNVNGSGAGDYNAVHGTQGALQADWECVINAIY